MKLFFKKHEAWLIFFGSLLLFLYGLFGRAWFGYETQYAAYAQEFLRAGPHFFATTNDMPGDASPAAFTLLIYLGALLTGKITVAHALLPSALAASFSLVLIYNIAAVFNRNWGRIAVLLALMTYPFFDAARSLTPAPFILLTSLWIFYRCTKNARYQTLSTHEALIKSPAFFVDLFIPLCCAFLMMGVLGFITTTLAAVAFFMAHAEWFYLRHFVLRACYLLSGLIVIAFFIALYQQGIHFAFQMLHKQLLDPFTWPLFSNYLPDTLLYYAANIELALASFFLLLTRFGDNTPQAKLLRALWYWLIVVWLLFSITRWQHKGAALLSMVPPMVLWAGYLWAQAKEHVSARIVITIFHLFCLALPFIAASLTIATIVTLHLKGLTMSAHYFSAFCALGVCMLASIAIMIWQQPVDYALRHPKRVIGIGVASFAIAMIFVVKPVEVGLSSRGPGFKHSGADFDRDPGCCAPKHRILTT